MARDGSVGKQTFEQVEALIKQGRSKKQAFDQIASDSGRNAGTVAANYYRVARANGTTTPRRRRGKATATRATAAAATGRRTPRGASNGNGDIGRLTADLVKSVTQLAEAMKAQSQEVFDLRERLDGVRSLLK